MNTKTPSTSPQRADRFLAIGQQAIAGLFLPMVAVGCSGQTAQNTRSEEAGSTEAIDASADASPSAANEAGQDEENLLRSDSSVDVVTEALAEDSATTDATSDGDAGFTNAAYLAPCQPGDRRQPSSTNACLCIAKDAGYGRWLCVFVSSPMASQLQFCPLPEPDVGTLCYSRGLQCNYAEAGGILTERDCKANGNGSSWAPFF